MESPVEHLLSDALFRVAAATAQIRSPLETREESLINAPSPAAISQTVPPEAKQRIAAGRDALRYSVGRRWQVRWRMQARPCIAQSPRGVQECEVHDAMQWLLGVGGGEDYAQAGTMVMESGWP